MERCIVLKQNIKISIGNMAKKCAVEKRGSYILEACIVLPAFIIAVIILLSLIPVITECENIVYASCDELRASDIKANFYNDKLPAMIRLNNRLREENRFIENLNVSNFRYRHSKDGIDDLISLSVDGSFARRNPMAAISKIDFKFNIRSRAFTGAKLKSKADKDIFNKNDKAEFVYIFPESGTKYHNKNCRFLNPSCEKVYLSTKIKSHFKPCEKCSKKGFKDGQAVFCFFNSGSVYHLGDCNSVEKYYEKIEKKEAVNKGYTACQVCGG